MKYRKMGIILILFGLFVPSVLYPYASLSEDAQFRRQRAATMGGNYHARFSELEIIIKGEAYNREQKSVPYVYFLTAGTVLVFAGAAFILLSSNKQP